MVRLKGPGFFIFFETPIKPKGLHGKFTPLKSDDEEVLELIQIITCFLEKQ